MAVLCILYKIRCNPMHPLNGALNGPYVAKCTKRTHLCVSGTSFLTSFCEGHRFVCEMHTKRNAHICTLMHRLAAEPRSTAGLLLSSRCPSGTILLTPYSMVWDWRVLRAEAMLFIYLSCSVPTTSSTRFPFLFFLSIGWYCGAGVFGLIGCISLSLNLALPTFFND